MRALAAIAATNYLHLNLSGTLRFLNCEKPLRFTGLICVMMPKFVATGRTAAEIRLFKGFTNVRHSPCWICCRRVGFTPLKVFSCMSCYAKFERIDAPLWIDNMHILVILRVMPVYPGSRTVLKFMMKTTKRPFVEIFWKLQ